MENKYKDITMIELNNLIQKTVENHNETKEKILKLLNDVEGLENEINSELILLRDLENNYIDLIEELNNR